MTYSPTLQPYAHQQEALDRMEGRSVFALFMEMRTGKTKVVLDDYGRLELEGKVRNLCVIAPGGVYKTWEGAISEHVSADLLGRLRIHVWQSGKSLRRDLERSNFLAAEDEPRALLINVESLSAAGTARVFVEQFLRQAPAMLVVDECVIIKNPHAKRTRFVNRTLSALAPYRRILSGLPTPRSPLDLYSELDFLDWRITGHKNYYSFRSQYATLKTEFWGGRRVQTVVGYRNLEELHQRIAPYVYRKLLRDCYDIPTDNYVRREVELAVEQRRIYNEFRDKATTMLASGEYVTATVVIAQIVRLHQILCGQAVDENGRSHDVDEYRTRELLSLLDDYAGKAVIWCAYDYSIRKVSDALKAEYGSSSVARFWGGNAATREEEEARFKVDSGCRWMVSTAAAGGRGRTWHEGVDLVVYHSNSYDLDHRAQSEERVHSVGKTTPVTYVDLVAPGTVDEKIISALRRKIDLAAEVTGDSWKEWVV